MSSVEPKVTKTTSDIDIEVKNGDEDGVNKCEFVYASFTKLEHYFAISLSGMSIPCSL